MQKAKKRKAPTADVFAVWGRPPRSLMQALTARQMTVLRRYTEALTSKVYRFAYDLGVDRGVDVAAEAAAKVRADMRKGASHG